MAIHPTAAIAPGAIIGKNVEIGPYAVVFDNREKVFSFNRITPNSEWVGLLRCGVNRLITYNNNIFSVL